MSTFDLTKLKNSTGFTLVEVLVAVSILLFIIVGPMTIAVQSSRSTEFATEQAVAFFLAQEGLELAQNARDNYQLGYLEDPTTPTIANPWTDFTNDYVTPCNVTQGCYLELDATATPGSPGVDVGLCSGSGCKLWRNDSAPGERVYFTVKENVGDTETIFTREVRFQPQSNTDEVKVTARVWWRNSNTIAEQEVVVDTYLYNIYDTP